MNYQLRLDRIKWPLLCSHLSDGGTWYQMVFGKHQLIIKAETLCQMS